MNPLIEPTGGRWDGTVHLEQHIRSAIRSAGCYVFAANATVWMNFHCSEYDTHMWVFSVGPEDSSSFTGNCNVTLICDVIWF